MKGRNILALKFKYTYLNIDKNVRVFGVNRQTDMLHCYCYNAMQCNVDTEDTVDVDDVVIDAVLDDDVVYDDGRPPPSSPIAVHLIFLC